MYQKGALHRFWLIVRRPMWFEGLNCFLRPTLLPWELVDPMLVEVFVVAGLDR